MRSASRPCSPVHHHEGHAKLASSPPRASPVRMGPSYVLKKGSEDRAGRAGQQGAGTWSSGLAVEVVPVAVIFECSLPGAVPRTPPAVSLSFPNATGT